MLKVEGFLESQLYPGKLAGWPGVSHKLSLYHKVVIWIKSRMEGTLDSCLGEKCGINGADKFPGDHGHPNCHKIPVIQTARSLDEGFWETSFLWPFGAPWYCWPALLCMVVIKVCKISGSVSSYAMWWILRATEWGTDWWPTGQSIGKELPMSSLVFADFTGACTWECPHGLCPTLVMGARCYLGFLLWALTLSLVGRSRGK